MIAGPPLSNSQTGGPDLYVSVPPTVLSAAKTMRGASLLAPFEKGEPPTVCARCFALQQKSSHVFVTSERCLRSQQPCPPKATISRMSGRPQRYYGNGELPAPSSVMPTSGKAPDVGHPSSLLCYKIELAIPPPQIGPTRRRKRRSDSVPNCSQRNAYEHGHRP
jgi:hypothetical protein